MSTTRASLPRRSSIAGPSFSAHPDTVFTRAELVREVWQQEFAAASRTVDVHVSRLRRKLGRSYGQCLVTEYRVGYQFRPAG